MSDNKLDKRNLFNRLQRYFDAVDNAESPKDEDIRKQTDLYHDKRGKKK